MWNGFVSWIHTCFLFLGWKNRLFFYRMKFQLMKLVNGNEIMKYLYFCTNLNYIRIVMLMSFKHIYFQCDLNSLCYCTYLFNRICSLIIMCLIHSVWLLLFVSNIVKERKRSIFLKPNWFMLLLSFHEFLLYFLKNTWIHNWQYWPTSSWKETFCFSFALESVKTL